MATEARGCPDSQTLDDLLAGRVAAARFAELESHVGGCSACGAVVAHLALSGAASRIEYASTMAAAPMSPQDDGAVTFALVDRHRFEVVREIAHGGMGRILEARDRRHGRTVALKTLLRPDAGARARFAREARITARLEHPGVVPLYETGRWSDTEPFLAMKLVGGRPLDMVVAGTGKLEERLALVPKVIAMTEALAFAHEKGVIHRDLKPSNVLLGAFGETIVIDWGLAKAVGDPHDPYTSADGAPEAAPPISASASLTREGTAVGTPLYMPPEQARGEPVDARADVYALGALLYHVLAGEAPYRRVTGSVIDHVLAGPPEPLATLAPAAPPDLLAIVEKAMSRDPEARYPGARSMAEDLRRFEAGKLVAAHTYSPATLVARWIARNRAVVAMAAALVVAVGLTAGLFVRSLVHERDVAHAARIEADAQRVTAVTQRDAAERIVSYLIGELRNRLDSLGKLDLLAGLGGEVEAYYRTVAPSDEVLDTAALERRATALELLSGVEWRRRNVALAATLMRGALEARAVRSARTPDDLPALVDLALAHASLANLLEQSDAPDFAQEDERAAALVHVLETRPDLPATARIATASVRATLAEAASTKGRRDEARALVDEARKAVAQVGDAAALDGTWQDRLAETEFAIAVVAFRLQDWPMAVESMSASVAIRRAMDERHPHHAGVLTELAASLRWLGEAHEERYEDRQAIDAHREALAIERALLDGDPGNLRVAHETAGTLTALCLLRREWDGPSAAAPACDEGRALAEKLSRSHPHDRQSWSVLTRALQASGESALAARRNTEALALFQSAVDAARHALSTAKSNRDLQVDVANCLNDLGRAELALGHADEARARTREALAIKEPLLTAGAEESTLVGVGECAMLLGDAEHGDEAHADYTRAVDLFAKAHAADADDMEPSLYLAKASGKLAAIERDPAARAELLRRAAGAIAPHLAAGRVSPEWRSDLAALDPHLVGAQVARLK